GEDAREIELERIEKSISREHTFARDCESADTLRRVLGQLVDDVGRRLRVAGHFAGVAHLKLRWKGFETLTRQRPLPAPSCDDHTLREIAAAMLADEPLVKPVRLIGFGVSRFVDHSERQLSLFDSDPRSSERHEQLSRTVDQIRAKHGRGSIKRGSAEDLDA
ncbi:MAG: hypothetical protein O3A51_03330, partial [Verrucomicrobia bacterium]|nr:hypothetical protein [Verrucomicrobiota bacterium]